MLDAVVVLSKRDPTNSSILWLCLCSIVVWPHKPLPSVSHHILILLAFLRALRLDSAILAGPIRQKKARTRARRWRKEQLRVREAEAREEQLAKEMTDRLRAEVAIKVKALEKQEALHKQR